MGKILVADDINVDQFVAVHSLADSAPTQNPALAQALSPVPFGVPLRVLEVSLPFVACAVIEPGGTEGGPVICDLRNIQLCCMDECFIDAIRGFQTLEGSEQQEQEQPPELKKIRSQLQRLAEDSEPDEQPF